MACKKKQGFFVHEINFVSKLHITKNQCIIRSEKNNKQEDDFNSKKLYIC